MTADKAPIVNYTSAVKFVIQILDARLFCILVTQQIHKRPIHCPSVSRITSGDPDLYQFPANDPNLHR